MTVVTVIFLPIVLIYQGWTFYVFRRRIDVGDVRQGAGGRQAPQVRAAPAASARRPGAAARGG